MDTKKLRQKILDLAIRGKLVPQDPNDEPASVLIEKIRAEKELLIKEKKIKRDKNESQIYRSDKSYYEQFADGTIKCIDDEIPFEIPESWEWCRWRNLFQTNPRNYIEDNDEVSFVPMTYIRDGYSDEAKFDIRQWKDIKSGFTHFQNNDLGIAKITPCFENRKSVVFKDLHNRHGAGTTELHIFRPLVFSIIADYVLYIAKSEGFIENGIANFTGAVGQQRVGKDVIGDYFVPLPPLQEISRILSSVSKLFFIVNSIENDESQLASYIQKTKSKILNLAIQGKLVPQDPNDEPASVLLERIKSEYPNSKKKAQKTSDNSHYENLPFEIPENWAWCRLKDICSIITDGTHQTPTYSDKGYIFLSSKNVTSGKIDWENVMYIPEFLHNQLYARLAPQKGDILLAKNGTTGFSAVVDRDCIFNIYVSLALLRPFENKVNPYYLRYIMSSSFVQEQFKANLKGIGVPNLHLENIRSTYIPICSLNEQNRIVSIIDHFFEILDNIIAEL